VHTFDIGVTAYYVSRQIATYQIQSSKPAMELMQELDRVLETRWAELGLGRSRSTSTTFFDLFHSDAATLENSEAFAALVNRWGDLWLNRGQTAVKSHGGDSDELPMLLNTSTVQASIFSSILEALSEGSSSRLCKIAFDSPNLAQVEYLLAHGTDPNERIGYFTIWEFVIHLVHSLSEYAAAMDLEPWAEIFILMLAHGADPHACCLRDATWCSVLSRDKDDAERYQSFMNHASPSARARYPHDALQRRGRDEERWNIYDTHPYYHSTTAVVSDVFEGRNVEAIKRLQSLLETKKRQSNTNEVSTRLAAMQPKADEPPQPDWSY
jgi:hypothetical protein